MPASEKRFGALAILGLAASAASAFMLAFPPFDLWPLIILAPALLATIARHARSLRIAAVIVFGVHWVMWMWVDRWLIDVTLLGYPTLAVYLSLYPVAFVGLMRAVARWDRLAALPTCVTLPIVWIGLECLKGELIWDGYAWFLLAHPFIHAPALVQSADLLGTYFVGLLLAVPAGALVDAAERPSRRRLATTIALTVVVIAANAAYGTWRLGQTAPLRNGPTIAVVQTNIPQSNKIGWSLEDRQRDFASFMASTRAALAESNVDIVAWPETMFPARGFEPGTIDVLRRWRQVGELAMVEEMTGFAAEIDVPMIVGSAAFDGLAVDEASQRYTWDAHYNSAYLLDGAMPYARYDKHILTPFGEVMPYISAWPWLEAKLLGFGAQGMTFTLAAAPEIHLLPVPWNDGTLAVGTPICFEDTVPRLCRRMVYGGAGVPRGGKQAAILVNLSNDGWFGGGDDVRAQHAQIARFRAIENRVPVVRCVNTGHSVSIDSCGRVVGTIGSGEYGEPRRSGSLVAETTLDARRTLYGSLGPVVPWGCLGIDAMLLAGVIFRRRTKGRTS